MDNEIFKSELMSEKVMATLKQMAELASPDVFNDVMNMANTFIRIGESIPNERKHDALKYLMAGLILSDGILRIETELAKTKQFEEEMDTENFDTP